MHQISAILTPLEIHPEKIKEFFKKLRIFLRKFLVFEKYLNFLEFFNHKKFSILNLF